MLVLCAKFSLHFWLAMPKQAQQRMLMSYSIEFAQQCGGKAKAYAEIDPESWSVEIHAEMIEVGI